MEIDLLKNIFFTAMVIVPRLAALFLTIPFLSRRILPGYIKNSVILCNILIIYPMVAPQVPKTDISMFILIVIIAKEVLIGFFIGFMVSCVFWVAESAGLLIDHQRGALSAMISDPMPQDETTPWGNLLFHIVTIIFFVNGGFLELLKGVFESYRVWPIFSFFPNINQEVTIYLFELADKLMRMTLVLAAPVVITCFVSEFGLGLVNRFAPQLNVFFLSMAIKSGVASIMLILYISYFFIYVKKEFIGAEFMLAFLNNVFR